MNFLENITFRRARANSEPRLNDSDVATSLSLNETVTSIPDMSVEEIDEVKKLRDQVMNITLELQTAHSRIEMLTLENKELRQLNENLTKKTCDTDIIPNSPAKTKRSASKKKSKNTQKETDVNVDSEVFLAQKKDKETHSDNGYKYQAKAPKICIISTDNKNQVLNIAENTLRWSQRCHYVTPHGNTQQLLAGIKEKLSDFSMEDYCIILIGEEDFKVTKVYVNIVTQLREMLQEIKHTNFIICTPTYKLGNFASLHNWRVELFNNLLYMDIITHEHAYFIDSNMNLNCDYHMFDRYTGRINNFGLKTIFKDVYEMILYIQSSKDVLNDIDPNRDRLSNNLFRM